MWGSVGVCLLGGSRGREEVRSPTPQTLGHMAPVLTTLGLDRRHGVVVGAEQTESRSDSLETRNGSDLHLDQLVAVGSGRQTRGSADEPLELRQERDMGLVHHGTVQTAGSGRVAGGLGVVVQVLSRDSRVTGPMRTASGGPQEGASDEQQESHEGKARNHLSVHRGGFHGIPPVWKE